MRYLIVLVGVVCLALPACAPPPEPEPETESAPVFDQAAEEAAVLQADEVWANAIAAKSLEQTMASYDSEAVAVGSAMFPARGAAAFRAQWAKLFAQPEYDLTWKADEVVVTESGTMACSSGTWRMAVSGATGPYLAVWRKQPDGQWKVLVDAAWYENSQE